ncbi:glycosyltransferase family 2 protein, partial [Campylobacter coli]|nr:glycosyltransferase family 2 protein [Campylobacter coli]
MQTKTIGVVIPIYNVEKYLKECLDSVINQSYTNLEIILVNDGSTDENSLNIAKEYTLKDKRITLFDKKNGGQSTARNVGIEYFGGEYKLKNKTQTIKENSLIEFNIEGDNPYEIYTVYKSYKAFNSEKDLTKFTYPIIDYIIFLDSDDYWELNCIEECVPRMDGVDVVWFDFEMFIDKEHKDINNPNWNRMRHFSLDGKISREEFEIEMIKKKLRVFAFVCDGLIDFIFFKKNKLKFFNYGYAEDHYFGLSCFLSLNNIYILRKKFYNYRVRSDSSCDFSQTYIINPNNKILFYIYKNMNYNAKEAMEYFRTYCYIETTLNIISFFETRSIKSVELFKNIIQFYYHRCRAIEQYNLDPMKIKKRLNKIFYYYSLFYEYKQLFNDKMGV